MLIWGCFLFMMVCLVIETCISVLFGMFALIYVLSYMLVLTD